MTIYLFISLLCKLLNTYIVYRFFKIFFQNRKFSIVTERLSYLLFFFLTTLIYLFINIPMVILAFNIIGRYLLTYNYGGKQKSRIFLTLAYCLMASLIELIVVLLSTKTPLTIHAPNHYTLIYGPLFSTIFTYLVVFIIEQTRRTNTQIKLPTAHWLMVIMIPAATFLIILFVLGVGVPDTKTFAFCCISALAINLAAFYLYDVIVAYASNKLEKQHLEQENKYYNAQIAAMDSFLVTMKGFKHDLKNHTIAMQSFVAKQEYQDLEAYLEETFADKFLKDTTVFCGNTAIDSILNYKIQEAAAKNVAFDVSVAIPKDLHISAENLVIILGNLLDNAIEAAEKVKDNPKITLTITYQKGGLYITVANPYIGELQHNKGGIITAKFDKENHGLGLKNVKDCINANGGSITMQEKNQVFTADVLLYTH